MEKNSIITKEKANFNTKVENTLDREGIVKITSVQLKKALKERKLNLEEQINTLDCDIKVLCKDNKSLIDAHVQKEFGDRVDSLTTLYKEESKQLTSLFQENTQKIVAEAESLFPDEYNLLSALRPNLPTYSIPAPTLHHHPEGDKIVVSINFMSLKITDETDFPNKCLDLKKKGQKLQDRLGDLKAELKKVNYKLNNFEDTKEEIEAELAKVDLASTTRGEKYLEALKVFGTNELKGIEG